MSNASLKEQLQAVVAQLSSSLSSTQPAPCASHRPMQQKQPVEVKPKWLERMQYGVTLLRTHFPACFRLPHHAVQPLKVGIKKDLVKLLNTMEDIVLEDKACMVKSLAFYVNTASYHKAMIAGVPRINLQGQPDGFVSPEEAAYSFARQKAKQQLKQQLKQSTATRKPSKIKEEVVT